jgi:glutathione-specific gamma-glutamylcyclotransferase
MTDKRHSGGLWVFGYGSLIWDPGFRRGRTPDRPADGWHRSFCMRSIHHRGSVASPGLVLALDRQDGALCDGVAFAGSRAMSRPPSPCCASAS